ncbi:MAG: glycosyltransferase, partial [Lentisphaeria bacterium]|nr:glycosyltransferase [Lentisphaeria bacterium]
QIARCAKSLFEQTFDSIEYIFVDDASPDHSVEVLEKLLEQYPGRRASVKILHHQENMGLANERITALQAASGDYVWCVDSDDRIAPDAVEKLYHTAVTEKADVVMFDFIDVFPDGVQRKRRRPVLPGKELIRQILRGDYMPSAVLLFCARSVYTEHCIMPVPHIDMGEDYATTPRLLHSAKKISFLPDCLYYYIHDNPESYCSNWDRSYLQQRITTYQTLIDFFEKHESEGYWREAIQHHIVRSKCQFYRLYGNSSKPDSEDLEAINRWHSEISFSALLKKADIPYKPIIILAYGRMNFLLRCYVKGCRCLYRFMLKLSSMKA